MANHVETYVTIHNVTEEVKTKLEELCSTESNESLGSIQVVNRLWGTNFNWNDSLTREENEELGNTYPEYDWMIENVGSKWVTLEYSEIEEDLSQINFITAWSFPEGLIQKLTDVLTEIDSDVYLSGTYEDEGYDPVGAFVWADGFDDIEDFDHDYETDQIWEDDEIRDKFYDELNELKQEMIDSYLEFLEDDEE